MIGNLRTRTPVACHTALAIAPTVPVIAISPTPFTPRVQKETQEAQRKRIEAAGVRDFQQIVAQGITPSLLEWKGIEATEKLATSSNAKVVIIGNPKNGLPLVLEPR